MLLDMTHSVHVGRVHAVNTHLLSLSRVEPLVGQVQILSLFSRSSTFCHCQTTDNNLKSVLVLNLTVYFTSFLISFMHIFISGVVHVGYLLYLSHQ